METSLALAWSKPPYTKAASRQLSSKAMPVGCLFQDVLLGVPACRDRRLLYKGRTAIKDTQRTPG
jgi:hypothetical protein